MRISDWSSDVCSSDLAHLVEVGQCVAGAALGQQLADDAVEGEIPAAGLVRRRGLAAEADAPLPVALQADARRDDLDLARRQRAAQHGAAAELEGDLGQSGDAAALAVAHRNAGPGNDAVPRPGFPHPTRVAT